MSTDTDIPDDAADTPASALFRSGNEVEISSDNCDVAVTDHYIDEDYGQQKYALDVPYDLKNEVKDALADSWDIHHFSAVYEDDEFQHWSIDADAREFVRDKLANTGLTLGEGANMKRQRRDAEAALDADADDIPVPGEQTPDVLVLDADDGSRTLLQTRWDLSLDERDDIGEDCSPERVADLGMIEINDETRGLCITRLTEAGYDVETYPAE